MRAGQVARRAHEGVVIEDVDDAADVGEHVALADLGFGVVVAHTATAVAAVLAVAVTSPATAARRALTVIAVVVAREMGIVALPVIGDVVGARLRAGLPHRGSQQRADLFVRLLLRGAIAFGFLPTATGATRFATLGIASALRARTRSLRGAFRFSAGALGLGRGILGAFRRLLIVLGGLRTGFGFLLRGTGLRRAACILALNGGDQVCLAHAGDPFEAHVSRDSFQFSELQRRQGFCHEGVLLVAQTWSAYENVWYLIPGCVTHVEAQLARNANSSGIESTLAGSATGDKQPRQAGVAQPLSE